MRKSPPRKYIRESTPLHNPYWEYSRLKIECERLLMDRWRETGFPVTIVRPSHTYGDGWLPSSFGSRDYTVAARMLEGREIVVHGDGRSLWVLTHTTDFAVGFPGLMGNPAAVGEAFHITSDECLSWDQIHRTIAAGLGVEASLVHVPSDIIAGLEPERGAGLLGDKSYSVLFDNSKIRRFVPEFQPVVRFHEGVRRSLAWYDAHPDRKRIDPAVNGEIERVLDAWHRGTRRAR